MAVSQKVATRISGELKRYQGVLSKAQQRDISESDTVVIIGDMLSDVMGYDKYQHITTEVAIRGTYVDLAVKVDEEIRFLIEAKPIGGDLKDAHIKQAIDYAANQGIDWVVLTNGAVWRIYKVQFSKPIDKILLCDIDILAVSPKDESVIECFGNLSKECFSKSSMSDLFEHKQITNKFAIAAVLQSDAILDELRLELRRLSGVRVDIDFLREALVNEVIKRDLIDGDDAAAACATVKRLQRALARERKKADDDGAIPAPAAVADAPTPPVSTVPTSPLPNQS